VAVAVSRVPLVGGHHAVVKVPFDEQRRRDAQQEHGRLFWVLRPPGAGGGGAEFWACRRGGSMQLEFTFAGVGAGHHAVRRAARMPGIEYQGQVTVSSQVRSTFYGCRTAQITRRREFSGLGGQTYEPDGVVVVYRLGAAT